MSEKLWYLVEDFNTNLDCKDGSVLALTPEACFRLNKTGIKYSIIEDFYDERDLHLGEDSYFQEQLQWFKKFDDLFREILLYCREKNISLARAHIYQIKCFVDSIIIQSHVLNEFFKGKKIDSVIYNCAQKSDRPSFSIYDLYNNQRKFLLPLVIKICEREKIALSIDIKQSFRSDSPFSFLTKKILKGFLKKFHLEAVYHFFKYDKIVKISNNGKLNNNLNILSLHAGCLSMDLVLRDLIRKGSKVFLKANEDIGLISSVFERKALNLNSLRENEGATKEACKRIYEKFRKESGLIGWISSKCKLDVSDIVEPYFKDFIENICEQNLLEIPYIVNFYQKEKIDFVIARASSEKESISSLLAAAQLGKRVCFQHSCNAMDSSIYHITELDLFDYYFAMHDEAEEHMNSSLRHDYVSDCKVFQSSHHLKEIEERWKKDKRNDNLVMYIPTKLFFGFRYYNENFYPLTWYFEFQKALVDLFAKRKEFRFIFKYAKGQDWSKDSILLYIKDKNYSNVSIEKRTVSDCLGKIGRAILDYPSTSLYEVATAGIPVISLYSRTFTVRDLPIRLFGNSLRKFNDISDAVKIINDFLDVPPEEFKVNIPRSSDNAANILSQIKRKWNE